MGKTSKKTDEQAAEKTAKRVIRLDDLEMTDNVVGGASEKLFFGESVSPNNSDERKTSRGFGFVTMDDGA